MAELVDLGKHCYLETCKKLDYTPFHCRECKQHFCNEHRFLHGCIFSKTYDPATEPTSSTLKPFLCSKQDCFLGESIKIVCPFCERNFCLQHRHTMEHDCQYVTKEKETDPAIAERLRRMHEMLGPLIKKEQQEKKGRSEESRTETNDPTPLNQSRIDQIAAMRTKLAGKDVAVPSSSQPPPLVTKTDETATVFDLAVTNSTFSAPGHPSQLPKISVQQQKEDRVAVMKLKMSNKGAGLSEKQILFVEWPGGRKPVFVLKSWTIGKAISQAKEDLKFHLEIKSICKRETEAVLDIADTVSHVFKEEDTLVLS